MSNKDGVEVLQTGTKVKTLHHFQRTRADDLAFDKNEILIIVCPTRDPNWYKAKNAWGDEGMVPVTHLKPQNEPRRDVSQEVPLPNPQNEPGRGVPNLKPQKEPRREVVKLQEMPWFHGKITREQSEDLLMSPRSKGGTFLVRESQHYPGDYTLSVCHEKMVEHYRIIYKKNKLTVDEEGFFENLFQLVEHYQKDADGLVCRLAFPLEKKGSKNVAVDSKAFIDSGWAIKRTDVKITRTLASGNFGDVCEGVYGKDRQVAIKKLKNDELAAQAFLVEASVMTSMKHPNLVELIGVVLDAPLLLVMEFMSKGNLVEYLRSRGRSVVKQDKLLQFSLDCAKGMSYLADKNLVHRDLAARNILISEEDKAKVSDFGLTAMAEHNQAGKELPIRWTAPESLETKQFTTKSDVWSFGILLWEIFSYGKVPYPRIPLADIKKFVNNNYRMENPDGCPAFVYSIMKECWSLTADERPEFKTIKLKLESVRGSVTR